MFDAIESFNYLGITYAYLAIDDDLSVEVFFRQTGGVDSLVFSKSMHLYIRWSITTRHYLA